MVILCCTDCLENKGQLYGSRRLLLPLPCLPSAAAPPALDEAGAAAGVGGVAAVRARAGHLMGWPQHVCNLKHPAAAGLVIKSCALARCGAWHARGARRQPLKGACRAGEDAGWTWPGMVCWEGKLEAVRCIHQKDNIILCVHAVLPCCHLAARCCSISEAAAAHPGTATLAASRCPAHPCERQPGSARTAARPPLFARQQKAALSCPPLHLSPATRQRASVHVVQVPSQAACAAGLLLLRHATMPQASGMPGS